MPSTLSDSGKFKTKKEILDEFTNSNKKPEGLNRIEEARSD